MEYADGDVHHASKIYSELANLRSIRGRLGSIEKSSLCNIDG